MQRLAIVMLCLCLQACASDTPGPGKSLWNSLFGTSGVRLTDNEIENMPYASQYVTLNGGPQIFVVLAYAENGRQKWVTQDEAMLITQRGRLVKTLGLGDNLISVTDTEDDPLRQPAQITNGARWARQAMWTEHQQIRAATLRSSFHWEGKDTLSVGPASTAVRVLKENVISERGRWENRYWVDNEGQIRKSTQLLGPNYYPITTLMLKAGKE
ncbi:YjbF family lipoprotein [Apirhabdus apintestini]|uniref:YjbF family lipoprotein n=1 Tax=Erwinia sp. HR93 TaxID=3094840 RepID=UPI002ADECDB4|nr:YjbF family lipoprotein [Erwinia sp. HR93]MEA1063202.1 YjbF family lipoprotein [Erwinia sp. HR93]WPM84992.1 YjbF family lipoprotein [Enterobacteriaceae bacterium CA-0114]